MNLLADPWIEVLTVDGPATLSLQDLATNLGDVVDIASSDPLVDAAILRLLLGADRAADGDLTGWLAGTRGHWHLFDPVAPFWQNPELNDHVAHSNPAVTLFYRHAGNGTVFLDHNHNENFGPMSAAEAARGVVMRQAFSIAGWQPFPESIFGTRLARAAVAAKRPLAWIDTGNLADTLAANRFAGPAGRFHFSWPAGARIASGPAPGGQADALSWQSRSLRLVTDSDGAVTGLVITEGLRYGPDTDPARVPHTTFIRPKANADYQVRDVYGDRPGWRQLLTAWADPDAPGILSGPMDSLADSARLRLTGLASFQSRIDGPVTGTLPLPRITRTAAAELDEGMSAARRALAARLIAAARIAAPSNDSSSPGAWWRRLMPHDTALINRFEPIVYAALTGQLATTEAVERLRSTALELAEQASGALASTHPFAAAAAMPKEIR